ncbi:MAG: histidine--tRNA ligase [Nitrososphaerota archaeon]|nr:histidine--tRNA ligase [Candidatus Bathyarchaeota archaeon]MDW8049028.1 histidine--tRNA ligase [Nitrososphaerota archaeon]
MSIGFLRTVRGMRDFLPDEAEALRSIEDVARKVARLFGYREVITPVVENYELLAAKIGEENRRRMYVFEDLGGRKVALRPEFTSSVARVVATKMQSLPKPLRLFSVGSLYRYDEPQFGRYREFWQANYELFGSNRPEADVEILCLANSFLKKVGLKNYQFKVGHVGILRGILKHEKVTEERQDTIMQLLDKKCWEEALNLAKGVGASKQALDDMKTLFTLGGRDADRLLLEMEEVVRNYPEALAAIENLKAIVNLIRDTESNLTLLLEAGFARGLEYYTGVIFEIFVPEMTHALGGGGRYDRLIELFGGGKTPAIGVAPGLDRILLALKKQGAPIKTMSHLERVLIIPVGDDMVREAFNIASILRECGICTEIEITGRSLSQALSNAPKKGIKYAVIVGSREAKEGKVVLRDLVKEEQNVVNINDLLGVLPVYE